MKLKEIKFENKDIIITDPCYIIRQDRKIEDWEACGYSRNMRVLGIKNYIWNNTIYGDWSCTVYDTDTNEKIGEFCADAGLVAVFDLAEVLAYNPEYDDHITAPWTTTLIKNFTGTVWFEQKTAHGVYNEDTSWCKKGEEWSQDYIEVLGEGSTNFKGIQTGF